MQKEADCTRCSDMTRLCGRSVTVKRKNGFYNVVIGKMQWSYRIPALALQFTAIGIIRSRVVKKKPRT
uniref:Uncharacterized protein n=1 Tax=Oryza brachyantha TaxID=4533 RepID=J3LYA1_ORYBR